MLKESPEGGAEFVLKEGVAGPARPIALKTLKKGEKASLVLKSGCEFAVVTPCVFFVHCHAVLLSQLSALPIQARIPKVVFCKADHNQCVTLHGCHACCTRAPLYKCSELQELPSELQEWLGMRLDHFQVTRSIDVTINVVVISRPTDEGEVVSHYQSVKLDL